MTNLFCWFDGSCGPDANGTAAYGYIIKDNKHNPVYASYGRVGSGPLMSCNVGEFEGLYRAMEWISTHHPHAHVVFYGDSQLVIEQMSGRAKARGGRYLPYYKKSIQLAKTYIMSGQWTFEWIPRSLNSEADNLAQYSRYPEQN